MITRELLAEMAFVKKVKLLVVLVGVLLKVTLALLTERGLIVDETDVTPLGNWIEN